MPEVSFKIAWPDGTEEACYSPSTVVLEYFEAGASYSLEEFVVRCRMALTRASDRVADKYGYHCSAAQDQLNRIEEAALEYTEDGRPVRVIALKVGPAG